MRTWERGSGITLACGTGACAVCVAGVLTGRTGRKLLAHLPGGDLELRLVRGRQPRLHDRPGDGGLHRRVADRVSSLPFPSAQRLRHPAALLGLARHAAGRRGARVDRGHRLRRSRSPTARSTGSTHPPHLPPERQLRRRQRRARANRLRRAVAHGPDDRPPATAANCTTGSGSGRCSATAYPIEDESPIQREEAVAAAVAQRQAPGPTRTGSTTPTNLMNWFMGRTTRGGVEDGRRGRGRAARAAADRQPVRRGRAGEGRGRRGHAGGRGEGERSPPIGGPLYPPVHALLLRAARRSSTARSARTTSSRCSARCSCRSPGWA